MKDTWREVEKMKLKRYRIQESGKVKRWFEGKGGLIASVVEGDFAGETQLRISSNKMDSIMSRGKFDTLSDEKLKKKIKMLIGREKYF